MQYLVLPAHAVQSVHDYLARRPHHEVERLIAELRQAQALPEPAPPARGAAPAEG